MEPRGYVEPHTCHHCASLLLFNPTAKIENPNAPDWKVVLKQQGRLQDRVQELLLEAYGGFHPRTVKAEGLDRYFYLEIPENDSEDNGRFSEVFTCPLYSLIGANLADESISPQGEIRSGIVAFEISSNSVRIGLPVQKIGQGTNAELAVHVRRFPNGTSGCVVHEDDPAAKYIGVPPPHVRPSSSTSFAGVSKWLAECIDSHPNCVKPRGDFMPTRLIRIWTIRGRRVLKLEETGDMPYKPYAVLSYCWGGEQKVQTTENTVRRHLMRINFTDLPRSIQDAVVVTEQLGLEYLWVDALCVIQDNNADRDWEVSHMSYVFSQAMVTISASRSPTVHDGFLNDRKPLGHDKRDSVFKLRYLCPDGRIGNIILVPPSPSNRPEEPLSKRAWAFQERLLSTRVLDYSSVKTHWICRSQRYDDGYDKSHVFNDIAWDGRLEGLSIGKDSTSYTPFKKWNMVLEKYSALSLTRPEDRLPAIAGIAERIARASHDDYLAGIWRSFLPESLIWRCADRWQVDQEPACSPGGQSREKYLAPSWSWASVSKPTIIEQWRVGKPVARVVNVAIEYCDPGAVFGRVKSGSLTIEAPMQAATCAWTTVESTGEKYLEISKRDDGSELGWTFSSEPSGSDLSRMQLPRQNSLRVDEEKDFEVQSTVVALLLVCAKQDRGVQEGLVLKRRPDGFFSRLGVFSYCPRKGKDWDTTFQVETITII